MKKSTLSIENKKDVTAYFMLIALATMMVFLVYKDGFLYGSKIDWISQHTVLADYFREKFYETGHLFPDFAINLGGGQNIYNLSYYGFLSPIILISYLLPSIPMITYISVISICIVIISGCLCYQWLRSNEFSRKIAFTAAACFIYAGPLIFQSHRQLMFMDYFVFLFLGLKGVDQYYRTHKKGMFILSVFLCIMTSYFFSVGCILTLLIYTVFVKLKKKPDCNLVELARDVTPFIKGIVIAVLMSAVLWLPTLYVIVNGRSSGGVPISWVSLIFPTLPFKALMYSPYSLGLTAISLIALVSILFSKKRDEKFLSFVLLLPLTFPIFIYLLNGTLYVRAKALIPFLPLYVLVIAIFLIKIELIVNEKINAKQSSKKLIVSGIFLLIIFSAGFICMIVNDQDELVSIKEYQNSYNSDKVALIQEVLKDDTSFYRMNELTYPNITANHVYESRYNQTSIYSSTYNKDYNKFFYDIMHNPITTRNRVMCDSSKNILFQNFMNVKYIVTKGNATAGYKKINQKGDYLLYENENTMPLGFATSETMSQMDYEKIGFPYNMGVIFENIIVNKDMKSTSEVKNESEFTFQRLDLKNDFPLIKNKKNIIIRKEGEHFYINATTGASIEIPLNMNLRDDILIAVSYTHLTLPTNREV